MANAEIDVLRSCCCQAGERQAFHLIAQRQQRLNSAPAQQLVGVARDAEPAIPAVRYGRSWTRLGLPRPHRLRAWGERIVRAPGSGIKREADDRWLAAEQDWRDALRRIAASDFLAALVYGVAVDHCRIR